MMKINEKKLFFKLCSFKTADVGEIIELLPDAATPEVLGHLFFNRMQATAYGVLKENELLGNINREFRNSLKGAYEQNMQKNDSYFKAVRYVSGILDAQKDKYAMLKGAVLCKKYPKGYRTSNDIDLLVCPEHVTQIGNVLIKKGFRQGDIKNGRFIPATRKEIIESKMMRGETVPYIKEVNLSGMQYLEIDLNFSLDYQNSAADTLKKMIASAKETNIDDLCIQTLCKEDFFIHLCRHLYKEATTMPWIEMKRDMALYKYCDIYLMLQEMTENEVNRVFKRASELNMTEICCFAIIQTAGLLEKVNSNAVAKALTLMHDKKDFMDMVISPKEKTTYLYREKQIDKRFFAKNRLSMLGVK